MAAASDYRNSTLVGFERRALSCVRSSPGSSAKFVAASRSGDRQAMIRTLLDAVGPVVDSPADDFAAKDADQTRRILADIHLQDNYRSDKYQEGHLLLTRALASAPSDSTLFFRALARRASLAFEAGFYRRCANDCELYLRNLSSSPDDVRQELSGDEERIDVLLMLTESCRRGGEARDDDAKLYLNEAMRAINELALQAGAATTTTRAAGTVGDADSEFRGRKAQLLKVFLGKRKTLHQHSTNGPTKQMEKTVPQLEGRPNEALIHCSDSVALRRDEARGRWLCATKNIKPGSVLIIDRPFAFSTDVAALRTNCLRCHNSLKLDAYSAVPCRNCQEVLFCTDDCRQEAWDKFHKYECRIFNYFRENESQRLSSLLAYRTVATAALIDEKGAIRADEEFLKLHDSDKKYGEGSDKNSRRDSTRDDQYYRSQDYKTVFNLETHCSRAEPNDNLKRAVHSVFLANCLTTFIRRHRHHTDASADHVAGLTSVLAVALLHAMQVISCNAYEIVENVRDADTKILEPRNVGGAIYPTVSLTNHGCYPNVVRHSYPCGVVVVRSIRFIPRGSEILDCYGQHFLQNDRDSRRKQLANKYHFECACEACTNDWPMKLPADQFNFKCKKCLKTCRKTRNAAECSGCGRRTEIGKLLVTLQNSVKKRLAALTRMYDDQYEDALPLLLDHAGCVDKILSEPSLEAVKTQQSIIQCLNAVSSTSV